MTRILLLTALLLPACGDETTCSDDEVTAACSSELDSKGACLDEGGCWGLWGLAAAPSCNCPATDADEACTGESACEGLCVHYEYEDDGSCAQLAEGACSDMQRVFGCFCTWQNGEGWVEICAD